MNVGLVSEWFTKRNLPLLLDELEDGDLLEFKRNAYSHWAVYVGVHSVKKQDGVAPCVIHRSLPSESNRSTLQMASASASAKSTGANVGPIIMETLEEVLGNDRVRINNRLDRRWPPFSPDEIVARAENLMAEVNPQPYSVMKNNCEHFVNRCRYGRKHSRQVISGCVKVGTSSLGVALTAANVVRAVAPLAAAGGGPMGAAVVAVAGIAVTVIPMAIQACRASQSSRSISDS